MMGASGSASGALGVAVAGGDAGESPLALCALTVTVYVLPFVRPVSTHVVAPLVVHDTLLPPATVAVAV